MRNVKRLLLWSVLLSVILESGFFCLEPGWRSALVCNLPSFLTTCTLCRTNSYNWMLRPRPAQTRQSSILFFILFNFLLSGWTEIHSQSSFICQSVSSHAVLFWRLPVPGASKFLPKWIHAHLHLSLVWTSVDIPQAVSCLPNPIYIFFHSYYCIIRVTSVATLSLSTAGADILSRVSDSLWICCRRWCFLMHSISQNVLSRWILVRGIFWVHFLKKYFLFNLVYKWT